MRTSLEPAVAIEAVLFDIDDTLVDFQASAAAGLARLLGERVPEVESSVFWTELTERHYPRFLAGQVQFHEMQIERLAELLAWAGMPVPERAGLLALEAIRQREMQDNYRLFPDVVGCLAALQDLRVGVVSNSDGPHQRAKIAGVGLAEAFEVVVISGDVGHPKPDPRIFAEACRQLRLPAERVAYVGDRLDIDAKGAAAAGLVGIWLNRAGAPDLTTAGPVAAGGVAMITSLDRLPAVVTSGRPL